MGCGLWSVDNGQKKREITSNKMIQTTEKNEKDNDNPSEETAKEEIHVEKIRHVEFFSGIGGMRQGLENFIEKFNNLDSSEGPYNNKREKRKIRFELESCIAYDISLFGNATYAHNFHSPPSNSSNNNYNNKNSNFQVRTKLIEQLKAEKDLLPLKSSLWTMSPPCQPYTNTRNAKQLDHLDKRTKSFFHLMFELLPKIHPKWILLENVKLFYKSKSYEKWCDCLIENGYTFREFIINPLELGVPNNRTRFYMICQKIEKNTSGRDKIPSSPSHPSSPPLSLKSLHRIYNHHHANGIIERQPISNFVNKLYPSTSQEIEYTSQNSILLSKTQLSQDWAKDLSIVKSTDFETYCFTSAYSRQLHKATGSLLLIEDEEEDYDNNESIDRENMTKYVGRIRKFTPKELLNLFGFPQSFSFPEYYQTQCNNNKNNKKKKKKRAVVSKEEDCDDDKDAFVDNEEENQEDEDKGFSSKWSEVTIQHQYKLIGQSVSVFVISVLFEDMFHNTY